MAPPAPPERLETQESEPVSVFLSKESLGGKTFKAGDSISLTVKSVDPDTGEVEAEVGENAMGGETKPGYEEAFDKAMPEEGAQ